MMNESKRVTRLVGTSNRFDEQLNELFWIVMQYYFRSMENLKPET